MENIRSEFLVIKFLSKSFKKPLDKPEIIYYNKGTKRERKENKMKNFKEMTKEELKKEIEKIEYKIFMEEMADFMDWEIYRKFERQLKEAKAELDSRE